MAPSDEHRRFDSAGFSLAGLALAGLFNLTHWHELNQLDLAWGGRPPADDRSLFATRGTCASYRGVAHQYTSINKAPRRTADALHSPPRVIPADAPEMVHLALADAPEILRHR